MKATGNEIKIENVFVGLERKEVPVMVKGKPTKRTKEICESIYANITAVGYEYKGHEIFIPGIDMAKYEKDERTLIRVYKNDGTQLTANCKFGRTGKANHEKTVFYNPKNNDLYVHTNGYDGPCGVGYGAYIKSINW